MCKFLHIRPTENHYAADFRFCNKGGVTIAYEVDNGELRYAFARCSENDNFCRKTGRTLAAGRLKSDRLSHTLPLPEGESPEQFLRRYEI